MLDAIEKLLVLQDRDRRIRRMQADLANIEPERQMLKAKTNATQSALDTAKTRGKQLESDRKQLELDVDAKKTQIEKYANQQLQTRKNEEYRALAHEIETCKGDINKLDDQQISLMEQAEANAKDVARCNREADDHRKLVEEQVKKLGEREANLQKDLVDLQSNRSELAGAVDEGARSRYERLVKSKGDNVIVGVNNAVCGGCHMKLPPQTLLACQQQAEIVTCNSCGRIVYFTRDMSLAVVD